MKKSFLLIVLLSLSAMQVKAQSYPVGRNAGTISGMGSYQSMGGELYSSNSPRLSMFDLSVSSNYFLWNNIFAGLGFQFSRVSQGDQNIDAIGIGPQIGFAVGGPEQVFYPYLLIGYRHLSALSLYGGGSHKESASGSKIFFGLGSMFRLHDHLGVALEVDQSFISQNSGGNSGIEGNIFSVSIGIIGFLY
jgi:hypothetical protein